MGNRDYYLAISYYKAIELEPKEPICITIVVYLKLQLKTMKEQF